MATLPDREIQAMAGIVNLTANARLIQIAPTGAPDPRGNTTEGAPTWEGSAPGFLAREDIEGSTVIHDTSRSTVAHIDTFCILDANQVPVTEIAGPRWKGTYVTIEDHRLTPVVTTRWRVDDLEHDAYGLLDSLSLVLADPVVV
jgi:hypothetical protein